MDKRFRVMCAAATLGLVACGGGKSEQGATIARVGEAAPPWTEPTSQGPALRFDSLRGKVTYLNFFATWCPPCNEEAPAIDALQQRFGGHGLQVVGVDVLENARKADDFRRQHHLNYPVIVDDGTLRAAYSVNGLPVHVFIDRSGVVRKIVVGEMSAQEMSANVQGLL